MSRSDRIAERIEEGAFGLAAFVGGLTEEEWRIPVARAQRDQRAIGVLVHHVASVYPIEVGWARTIGRGEVVTEVTWDAVATMNAEHARAHANVTRKAALELLRGNSREADAEVRSFTDQELDAAAPFALGFGAGDGAVRSGGPRREARLAPPRRDPTQARPLNPPERRIRA